MAAAVALGSMVLGACDDLEDDDEEPVTQETFDEEAASLCGRFGAEIDDVTGRLRQSQPDADRISFLRAEFVPSVRSIVQSLETFGYPPAQSARYNQAEAVALNALDEIEDDAPELVDRLVNGTLLPEESPFVDLEEALRALDIPC